MMICRARAVLQRYKLCILYYFTLEPTVHTYSVRSVMLLRTELSPMLFIHQHISVPRLALLHTDHGVVGLFHRISFDPGLDLVIASEFEAFGHTLDGTYG